MAYYSMIPISQIFFHGREPIPYVNIFRFVFRFGFTVDTCWSNPSGGQQPWMVWLQKKNRADWLWWLPHGGLAPEFLQCYESNSGLKNVIRHKERHALFPLWFDHSDSLLSPLYLDLDLNCIKKTGGEKSNQKNDLRFNLWTKLIFNNHWYLYHIMSMLLYKIVTTWTGIRNNVKWNVV